MTVGLVIRRRAEADIRSAVDYYEDLETGRGKHFTLHLDDLFDRLRQLPQASPVIYKNVRRALLRDYPFSIFYLLQPTRLIILAVLHQAQNPSDWPAR